MNPVIEYPGIPLSKCHAHACQVCRRVFPCPTNEPGPDCPPVCLECLMADEDE